MELALQNQLEIQNKELNLSNRLTDLKDNFLNSSLGQVINSTLDIGLRLVLPQSIENEAIKIKESLIQGGLKEGITTAIDVAIDKGKELLGIKDSMFKSVSQIANGLDKGDLIKGVSAALDKALKKAEANELISKEASRDN